MKKYWGKGFATEAAKASVNFGFNKLGLNRMIAMVLSENAGSIRVLQKLILNLKRRLLKIIN
ncbi:GNAT family N-acetyltransferase [Crocinitomix catalasitica]|uniref:GNAT family N-acetyltransferase n=1 Tax=Crocinitomix catalasitica TaxID=184607 RepID=UPI000687AB73|nr:GNAT family N-acetyltransferase [Crocinitomix catalasitica]